MSGALHPDLNGHSAHLTRSRTRVSRANHLSSGSDTSRSASALALSTARTAFQHRREPLTTKAFMFRSQAERMARRIPALVDTGSIVLNPTRPRGEWKHGDDHALHEFYVINFDLGHGRSCLIPTRPVWATCRELAGASVPAAFGGVRT